MKAGQKVHSWSIHGMAAHTRPPCTRTLALCLICMPAALPTGWGVRRACSSRCGAQVPRAGTRASRTAHRRSTPWRELTSYFLLRPRGASLLAQTGRSEQGDVRSQSRWAGLGLTPRPPPSIGLMASAGRPAAGGPQAQATAPSGIHDKWLTKYSYS